MRFRFTMWLFLIALLAAHCANKTEAQDEKPKNTGPIAVGTHKVAPHKFQRKIEISADVLAHQQVTLISKVPGEVKKMYVAEGDKVRKGDLVAKLDQTDFRLAVRQAKAQLAAAKAGVTAAEIGLDTVNAKERRLSLLRQQQVISESDYEDIEGAQRSTKANVTLAQSQVQLAEVGLEAARTNLSYTEIRAPFDGEVAKRMVDEGARLNAMPPTPIVLLVDASELEILGAVSERDLPFVSAGMPVTVTVDALPDAPIEAEVDRVEPVVDPQSRTAGIQVLLENQDRKLQPGMSARLVIDLGTRESVAVPDDVVIRAEIDSHTGVLFVLKDGKAIRRRVRLGDRQGDLREVLEGLKPGDIVVRGGQERLKDGQRVIVGGSEKGV